uniref:Uncharacterized protein n=1 Tax=Helicotheca tamesis TaxID=374047 RepID=A0A7S2MBQ2_9STRA
MLPTSSKIGNIQSILFWLTCICLHCRSHAFISPQLRAENPSLLKKQLSFGSSSPARYHAPYRYVAKQNDFEAEDDIEGVSKVVELLLEMSLEPSNEKRRGRLSLYLDSGLNKSNGELSVFIDTFQSALETAGTQVQLAAREKAVQIQRQIDSTEMQEEDLEVEKKRSNDELSIYDGDEEMMSMGKSDEERRLWALVDMMVQSKIIIKKAKDAY